MNKNRLTTLFLVLFLIGILIIIYQYAANQGWISTSLISPAVKQGVNQLPKQQETTFNPPKEVKYDSATNLKDELNSINPEVLDEDFE